MSTESSFPHAEARGHERSWSSLNKISHSASRGNNCVTEILVADPRVSSRVQAQMSITDANVRNSKLYPRHHSRVDGQWIYSFVTQLDDSILIHQLSLIGTSQHPLSRVTLGVLCPKRPAASAAHKLQTGWHWDALSHSTGDFKECLLWKVHDPADQPQCHRFWWNIQEISGKYVSSRCDFSHDSVRKRALRCSLFTLSFSRGSVKVRDGSRVKLISSEKLHWPQRGFAAILINQILQMYKQACVCVKTYEENAPTPEKICRGRRRWQTGGWHCWFSLAGL